jgi:hypothetical protein
VLKLLRDRLLPKRQLFIFDEPQLLEFHDFFVSIRYPAVADRDANQMHAREED